MSAPATPPKATVDKRPRSLRRKDLRFLFFQPRRPVRWLAPIQLAATGVRVFLAGQFGAYLDKRELQKPFAQEAFDESKDTEGHDLDELWVDYVADTGDGFHATYAVALALAQRELVIGGQHLPRGHVLIMGGDQVYPTPSAEAYDDRLRGPFRAALPAVGPNEPAPTLYTLPGNHDWYDGLTAFFRVFGGAESSIGAWKTRQKRSYFALQLPGRWWLLAVDAQQGAHIDDPQLEYFHQVINDPAMQDGDRVILCNPVPGWVQSGDEKSVYDAVDYFMRKVISTEGQAKWLGQQRKDGKPAGDPKTLTVPLMLAGDWHHYARYERIDASGQSSQLITSGGGGAYLYPTHKLPRTITVPPKDMRPPKSEPTADYRLRGRFPSYLRSWWLSLGVLVRLPVRNWSFVAMLGILQAMLMFSYQQGDRRITLSTIVMTLVFLALSLLLAVGLAAGRPRLLLSILLVAIHTAGQVSVLYLGLRVWPQFELGFWTPGNDMESRARDVAFDFLNVLQGRYLVYGVAAGLVSAVVVALYLLLASVFNLNLNELFSSQGIEGYKGFVRLHITKDGPLTIYAVGLRRVRRVGPSYVPLHWRVPKAPQLHDPWFLPRRRLRTTLIERITIP